MRPSLVTLPDSPSKAIRTRQRLLWLSTTLPEMTPTSVAPSHLREFTSDHLAINPLLNVSVTRFQ